ncbi:PQQ-dependent sugar dehydrogenase [Tautonia sociabilis]|uniref:Glucose sorbosone dehydrogenase n=1 Tax=Tautonia sociabilis TaxID=2080755 RepID=A0A432MPA1_9BACT|nr:PQQ-dependent sugar dehydrogenase [Tautonia sociabilis]RUL89150.1 glucose sorbosone dehydrogenase [Tautonia sociabilis]
MRFSTIAPARLGLLAGLALAFACSRSAPAAAPSPQGEALPKLVTEVAFPNLKFDRPVVLAYPKDGSNLLFVVEQHTARIFSFPNQEHTDDLALFLELPREIGRDNEEGLLGLAFHPNFAENGQFFVYYSARNPRRSVVSRFTVSEGDPTKADPNSEVVIWESAPDPYGNHNGGHIDFGPDGFLYITLGDSGAADDPLRTGQDPTDWFGSILRIDVDHPEGGKPYGIPADNPAKRDPKFSHWAPEVFAIGLRNVWKFSFDRESGDLWAGDVGQNKWEEVVKVVNAGNYGWNVYEGFHPFQLRGNRVERSSPPLPPIVEYPHPEVPASQRRGRDDVGKSITGGYVYRGDRLPELRGYYVYGDFETGRIWGVKVDDQDQVIATGELIDLSSPRQPKLNISAFGEDPEGNLYILAFDGRIHRFRPAP